MQNKLSLKDWFLEFADVAQAIADQNATIESYNGNVFAVYDDGEIYPLDNNTRIRLNADLLYYQKNPDCRIVSDYCQSTAESLWKFAVGGILD